VDTDQARPRWRLNASYRATPRLSLGVEYNPAAGEFAPTANWIAHAETGRWPLVSFGTSSDRIFTPRDNQAYYVTFAKTVPGTRAAPYAGVSYSEFEGRLLFPCGLNVSLAPQWDALAMYDGRNSHLLLTYKLPDANVTLLWLRYRQIGVSLGFGF
jgi:hypothetical protein